MPTKVYFCHSLEGHLKTLFSVAERGDKSLIIALRGFDNIGKQGRLRDALRYSPDNFQRPLRSRISIHNSDRSSGLLVKLTHEFPKNSRREHPCFIKNAKHFLCHPLYASLSSDFIANRYDPPRTKHLVHQLGASQNADAITFCYCIVAFDHKTEIPTYENISVTVQNFTRYRVAVYHCFVDLAPNHEGISIFPATEIGGVGDGGINSLDHLQLHKTIVEIFHTMLFLRLRSELSRCDDSERFHTLMANNGELYANSVNVLNARNSKKSD